MTFTKGPWFVRWKPVTVSVHAPNGDYITENVRELPNQDANARLIAAAPELYEALKAMMAYYDTPSGPADLLAQASAALAKADGGK